MHDADITDDRKAVAVKKRIITATFVVLPSLWLSGCTLSFSPSADYDPNPVACTLIGAEPLVSVEIPVTVMDDISQVKLTACNDHGECTSFEQSKSDIDLSAPELGEYYISTAWPYSEERAHVTLDLTRGDTVISSQTDIDLVVVSPNGPKCPPHVLQGSVIFDGERWSVRTD